MEFRQLKSKEPGEPEETIWKEFPKEIIESVLARVPIATLFRFRLVCRKWNSLPFLKRCIPKELPLFYALVGQNEALYDPLVKKWYFIIHTSSHPKTYPNKTAPSFRVLNHSLRSMLDHCSRINDYNRCAVALADYPGGYRIVWVRSGGEYGVYDLSKGKWTVTHGRVPDNINLPCSADNRGLAIGNVVYFNCNNNRTLSFDTVSGVWEPLVAHYPPDVKYVGSLAEGEGGRLLLVGTVKCDDVNEGEKAKSCSRVCIWELDAQERRWVEADRMPSSLWSEFKYVNFFKVLGTRRLLVISTPDKGVFTYDVVSREWSKLPDCIPPGCTMPQRVFDGITFFPCLSASP